jgi:hypothetical protein
MATARITPKQKQIFDAHLEAYKTGNWDYPKGFKGTANELMALVESGKTFKGVWEQVVSRYVSVTSQLIASPELFNHTTDAYVKQARDGFKILLNLYNIK